MFSTLLNEISLAIRNLSRNRSRTVVGLLTVASGVVAYLLAGGFIAWIFQDMREATIHSQLGHAQIVRPAFFDRGIANPYAFLLPANSPELEMLAAMPGVVSVTPRLVFSGLISLAETTVAFAGKESIRSANGRSAAGSQSLTARISVASTNDGYCLARAWPRP